MHCTKVLNVIHPKNQENSCIGFQGILITCFEIVLEKPAQNYTNRTNTENSFMQLRCYQEQVVLPLRSEPLHEITQQVLT